MLREARHGRFDGRGEEERHDDVEDDRTRRPRQITEGGEQGEGADDDPGGMPHRLEVQRDLEVLRFVVTDIGAPEQCHVVVVSLAE